MALARGFKSWANKLADDTRQEIGVGKFDQLDPRVLAEYLGIPIYDLSFFQKVAPSVSHLLNDEPEVFSAVTVFDWPKRFIVHNDRHHWKRQNSNLCHELSHGLLHHPPTPALDDKRDRIWNGDLEEEANLLAGCLLIGKDAAFAIAKGNWSISSASNHFGASEVMVNYRVNATGSRKIVSRIEASRI